VFCCEYRISREIEGSYRCQFDWLSARGIPTDSSPALRNSVIRFPTRKVCYENKIGIDFETHHSVSISRVHMEF